MDLNAESLYVLLLAWAGVASGYTLAMVQRLGNEMYFPRTLLLRLGTAFCTYFVAWGFICYAADYAGIPLINGNEQHVSQSGWFTLFTAYLASRMYRSLKADTRPPPSQGGNRLMTGGKS
jgi:hypothetical protein